MQGEGAPQGLFNLFSRTMQSPNLSIGSLCHEIKLMTVHVSRINHTVEPFSLVTCASALCLHMFVK